MKIPDANNSITNLIYKSYEDCRELPRPHIGASQLGHPCDRKIWLQFRHAVIEKFDGRMLLLFKRGHEEENRIVSNLRRIGIHVEKTGSNQARVDFGFHVAGSADGIISNLPNGYKGKALLECKTHSEKSFNDLVKNGVQKSKPEHWIQCCIYGFGLGLDRALYYAVNKNNDEVYTEWLHLDFDVAKAAIARGKRIALSDRIPEPLSTDETWYQCKYCPAHDLCFGSKTTKEVNCRTCCHSTAKEDSTWRCERYEADGIPIEHQHKGCDAHVLHPDLFPHKRLESANAWTAVYEIEGKRIENGDPCANVFSSKELLANLNACLHQDEFIEEVRTEFGGRVVA